MITVAGEALIDLVVDRGGSVTAFPGGAPFNVARMVGRLGEPCQFLGRLGDDAFADLLRETLAQADVTVAVRGASGAPTTLAVVSLDEAGVADYRFYLEGTAAASLSPRDIPVGALDGTTALALGGLGVVAEPTASTLLGLVRGAPPAATVILDPNCRPSAIPDPACYPEAVGRFIAHADIVKVSVEDLRVLAPGSDSAAAAAALLRQGPAAVLVTAGPDPVAVHTAGGELTIPVEPVRVVDTVGAGDAFVAAFAVWWTLHRLGPSDAADLGAVARAGTAAVTAARAACTVAGATLPDGFGSS